ncbi:hypothetical protein ASS97_12440 [Staphylococcus equorum]|uniref:restriction endonuclease subunit S n=2 Tax=Staphylococcus equorum TaxID=246432 RepID=UPI000853815C|nr:restriction endonuclease subunit S [Staphylococcus equorum]OEK52623.1 hypothetical protein ASS97_12440 [Staphylococcus equorum]RYD12823.1 restriction endonuclease subunit S [Staphylococcus equorum]
MTNEIKNVPELRFPEFKEEWVEKKLGEITSKISDGIHSTPTYDSNGDIYFINGNNLVNGRIDFKTSKKISVQEFNKYKNYLEAKNTLLLSINGTIGNIAKYEGENILLGKSAAYINVVSKFISRCYIFYYLQTSKIYESFLRELTGTTIKNLSLKSIKNIIVYISELDEQQKIGEFFSKLDRQIELEEQKLEKLEEQKKGYMQKIFSQEVRFKDDNGNSYPEWESAPLFDIFSATKGKSLSKDKISDDGKYECILYGEIYTTYAEKIESIVSRTNYYEGILSKKNDLIFPNSTTTNAWDLATFSSLQKNNVLIGGDISILRTKRSDISSLFYAYYLTNYLKLRKDIAKYAQGITIVHLSFNNFCKIKVQIPSLEEQNSITDFIDSLNQQQKLITNKIKLLKEHKKGFLQKMFV